VQTDWKFVGTDRYILFLKGLTFVSKLHCLQLSHYERSKLDKIYQSITHSLHLNEYVIIFPEKIFFFLKLKLIVQFIVRYHYL
jgi:hypothetical protein